MDSIATADTRPVPGQEIAKTWVDGIQFEVLGNLRTDFTLMTYSNQPSRNRVRRSEVNRGG